MGLCEGEEEMLVVLYIAYQPFAWLSRYSYYSRPVK